MRRIVALACGAVCLAAPAPASAVITATRDANALASAAAGPGAPITGSTLSTTVSGNPTGISTTPLGGFPLVGDSFPILSSGDVTLAANPDQDLQADVPNGGAQTPEHGNAQDITIWRIDFDVPASANCLTFGFRFLSDEYPEYVGEGVNDGFIAQVDRSDWVGTGDGITAEGNFAYDEEGRVISVNSMPIGSEQAPIPSVTAEAQGTVYDGATPRLSAAQPVTPGAHSLYLSIFDQSDQRIDSTVFVDRLALLATEPGGCVRGATEDVTPPAVTLGVSGSTAEDTTPTLGGTAGDAPGDAANVTVRIFAGGAVAGAPVQTLGATRSGTSWAVDSAPLAPGTYTAQADQSDTAGNTGFSAPATFTVSPPPPPPPTETLLPDVGKSVVVAKVSGTVRVKTRGGRFRTLGATDEIPVGSTVDATKGRVRLTSAAGGGAVQTADFYKGQFLVTQTRGSRPITELRLNAAMRCGKGRASAARKRKKVRRLWGNGTGRFRTRGRHGAATVRGTRWLTQDRCNSTKFTVRRGSITVRDFVKKRNKVVRQGKSFTVKKKKRKR